MGKHTELTNSTQDGSPALDGVPADERPTIHVLGLHHTIPNIDFSHCAFTGKVLRFPEVAHRAGFRVVEYSNGPSASNADEHVTIFGRDQLAYYFGNERLFGAVTSSGGEGPTHSDEAHREAFHSVVRMHLAKRYKPGDIIAHTFNDSAAFVQWFPDAIHVETGIGYASGPIGAYRIFESETWRAWHMGKYHAPNNGAPKTDEYPDFQSLVTTHVVPNYYNANDWHSARVQRRNPYVVFVGRMTSSKGIEIVNMLAMQFPELRFVCVSGEERSDRLCANGIDWRGRISDRRELSDLYARAVCTIVPSRFHEPFGGVCAEALLSGCPVLASNFAAFVEHVQPEDGLLCGSRQEFTLGLRYMLDYLSQDKVADREARRERAVARWGYDAVGLRYRAAFMAIKRDWENGVRP